MLPGTDKNEQSDSAEINNFFYTIIGFLTIHRKAEVKSSSVIHVGGMGTSAAHRR